MREEVVLLILGEEYRILHDRVIKIKSICEDIRVISNSQENICRFLTLATSYHNIIEESVTGIEVIKSKLDIRCKNGRYTDYTNEIDQIRNYLIGIFSNLREMSSAIRNDNDVLLNKYNNTVLQILEQTIL